MKALTLWQPYAELCVLGVKHYETRSWALPKVYEGTELAIHASVRWDKTLQSLADTLFSDLYPRSVPLSFGVKAKSLQKGSAE